MKAAKLGMFDKICVDARSQTRARDDGEVFHSRPRGLGFARAFGDDFVSRRRAGLAKSGDCRSARLDDREQGPQGNACDGSGVIVVGPAIWPSWSAPTSTDDRGAKKPGGRRCGPVPRAPLRRYARSRGRIELEWSGSPSHRGHAPWLPRTNEIAHARLACAKHWSARGGRDAVARGCERAPLACRRHARRRAGDGLKLCGADAASPPPPSPPASERTTRAREQR